MSTGKKGLINPDLSNELYMDSLLKYYELLTNGRVKPNSKSNGDSTVRESVGEADDIAQVKAKFAILFKLDTSIKYHNNRK